MNSKNDNYKYLTIAICLLCLAFAVCFTIGFTRNLTNIPYWDSWHSVWLYEQFFNGNYKEIFSVHNEHPIFLTNIIFLLNYWLFNGSTIALQILNFILILSVALMLFYLHRTCNIVSNSVSLGTSAEHTALNKKSSWYNSYFLFLFCFYIIMNCFWGAEENINWEFESQWYLSILLPVTSLLLLLKTSYTKHSNIYFAGALIAMFCSPFTMMNGMLFVLLAIFTVFINKFTLTRKVLWLIASLISILILFKLKGNTQLHTEVQISDIIKYFLLYIGSIGNYIIKGFSDSNQDLNLYTSYFFGIAYILSVTYFVFQLFISIRKRNHNQTLTISVLLAFMLYFICTALVTALGRVNFGILQALSSRYVTIAIAGWSVLFMQYFLLLSRKKIIMYIMLILCILMMPLQFHARKATDKYYLKNINALALALGKAPEYTDFLFPAPEYTETRFQFIKKQEMMFWQQGNIIRSLVEDLNNHKKFGDSTAITDVDCTAEHHSGKYYLVMDGRIKKKLNYSFADEQLQPMYALDNSNTTIGVGLYNKSKRQFRIFVEPEHQEAKIFTIPSANVTFRCKTQFDIGNNIMHENKVYGRQIEDDAFVQSFTTGRNAKIEDLELLLATFGSNNTGTSTIALSKCNGEIIKQHTFDNTGVADNQFKQFEEFNGLTLTANTDYCLSLTSKGTNKDNGITWWLSTNSNYTAGKSLYKDAAENDDFLFILKVTEVE